MAIVHQPYWQRGDLVLAGGGCPNCKNVKKYSKIAIKWLKPLEEKYPDIRHAEKGGEYAIPETNFKADGYSKEYNIIFEMLGCLWHGCQSCFPNKNNPFSGKPSIELYNKTMEKIKRLEELGYEVIYVWEHELN